MSTQYVAVQWNAQKKRYDGVMGGAVFAFLATFIATGKLVFPTIQSRITSSPPSSTGLRRMSWLECMGCRSSSREL